MPTPGPGEEPGWKRMFTLYVHPGQNYSFSSDSLFHDSPIQKREKVEWGQFSVVRAPPPPSPLPHANLQP